MESPKDRQLYKHFDFLNDSVPSHSQKNIWLGWFSHSGENQKACQPPAEKQFNLVTYRPVMGS